MEERAAQSPLFAEQYSELLKTYSPFIDVLIPENHFLLGVDYDAS
jgi:hypothetical protein